jgi:hypothetical protein
MRLTAPKTELGVALMLATKQYAQTLTQCIHCKRCKAKPAPQQLTTADGRIGNLTPAVVLVTVICTATGTSTSAPAALQDCKAQQQQFNMDVSTPK